MAEGLRRRASLLLPAAGLVAGGVALLRRASPHQRPGSPYLAGAPLLVAHRGGSLLAPENTLLAFRRAIDWWRADVLELDVQSTREGEAVVFHDETLDRTTEGAGPVTARSLAEIRALDAGYRFTPDDGATFPFRGRGIGISTLAEVLDACREVRVNIEIKDGRAQESVWRAVQETGAVDRVLIAAGTTRNRARLAGYPVPVSAGKEQIRIFLLQHRLGLFAHTPAVDALQVPARWDGREVVTPGLVRAAHARNIAVHVWTVDEIDEMNRLLDWGVDGVMTDRPDRLARVLHERVGRPLPPGAPTPLPESFLERLLRT